MIQTWFFARFFSRQILPRIGFWSWHPSRHIEHELSRNRFSNHHRTQWTHRVHASCWPHWIWKHDERLGLHVNLIVVRCSSIAAEGVGFSKYIIIFREKLIHYTAGYGGRSWLSRSWGLRSWQQCGDCFRKLEVLLLWSRMGICNIKHCEIDRDNGCIFLFFFWNGPNGRVSQLISISVRRIILIPSCLKNASLPCYSAWFCLDWKVWRNGGVGLRSWGWQRWTRDI